MKQDLCGACLAQVRADHEKVARLAGEDGRRM